MAFPPAFLDELRARVPLSEVIGRKLRLQRAGREWKAPCPFHNEKTPSFYVNDQKAFFHCFGCGAHGDVVGFLMRHDNLSFPDAVEQLAGLAGLEVPRPTPQERQKFERQKTLYDVLESACAWFEQQLRAPHGRAALGYLRDRGLDDEAIAQFRLGWAPADASLLGSAMRKAGHNDAELMELQLLRPSEHGGAPYSFFRNRVLFPVADRRGRIVAFGGRILDGDGPKYVNSPEHPLFHKGQVLYGLSRARGARDATPIVVEGYMDVIALQRAGFEGAVAPLGTALTEAQLAELWRLDPGGTRPPVLCFDGDAAGRRAAERAITRALPLAQAGRTVRVAFLPTGEDPDSLIRSGGPAAMRTVLDEARSLVDALWDTTLRDRPRDTPEQRAGIRRALDEAVATIADKTCQGLYRQEIRTRWDEAFPWRTGFGAAKGRAKGGDGRVPGVKPSSIRSRRAQLNRLRDRLLLGAVLVRPELWDEVSAHLTEAALPEAGEQALKVFVQECLEADSGLDAPGLWLHLDRRGLAGAATSLLNLTVARVPRLKHQDAEEARAQVRELLLLDHRLAMEGEIAAATKAPGSGADPALERITAITREKTELIEGEPDAGTSGEAGASHG
jgi:DNA primase